MSGESLELPDKSELMLDADQIDEFVSKHQMFLVREENTELADVRRIYRIGGETWCLDPATVSEKDATSTWKSGVLLHKGEPTKIEELPIEFEIKPVPHPEGGFAIQIACGAHVFYVAG